MFLRCYKMHLARRLICQTSSDFEMEENMIHWLKHIGSPCEFIDALQRMLRDIKVGMDFNDKFKDAYRGKNEFLTNTANFNVLNSGAWPLRSDHMHVPVTLPTEIAENIPHMEEYYTKQFSTRKL